jgi:acetyltransferase-like isoleucine patch superfamily enzyme
MRGRESVKRLLVTLTGGRTKIRVHPSATFRVSNQAKLVSGIIVVGRNSSVTIEAGVIIDSDMTIGDNCKVVFEKNSRLVKTSFSVTNSSTVNIGEGAIINSPVSPDSWINIDNGTFRLGQRAHLFSTSVLVRFGGTLTIGRYTGVAYDSEIRCEQQVDIGSYNMISYRVCIYDTNTHSTDWRERRKRIEHGYPEGVYEETKPDTRPVFIGDDVWIGKEATITKGARVGNRCIIGIRTILGSEVVDDDSIVVAGKPRIITKRQTETVSTNA